MSEEPHQFLFGATAISTNGIVPRAPGDSVAASHARPDFSGVGS